MKKRRIFEEFKKHVWRVAFTLFALVLFTSQFSLRYVAKYVSKDFGEDEARVAKFSFVLTSENLKLQSEELLIERMMPGTELKYEVELQNESEVALRCTVFGKNETNNLPLTLTTVILDVGKGETKTTDFFVKWDENENSLDFMGKVDWISLTVEVSQID